MEAGGLPLVWVLKTFILVMPALLLLQAWSTASACLAALRR
jgi:TRAP-type mannitol/chloroaromatic compound transport system permease small subunit